MLGKLTSKISVQAAPALWEPTFVPERGDSLPAPPRDRALAILVKIDETRR